MTTRLKICCSALLLMLVCSLAPSDDKKSEDKQPDKNAQAVDKFLGAMATAFNERSAKALGELFTPTGEFIDGEENVFQGREAIIREFTVLFEKNPKNSMQVAAQEIREISVGVLKVDAVATMSTGAEEEADSDRDEIEITALVIRQADGRWLFASVHSQGETDDPTPHGRLKQLDWLIGDWVDESRESSTHTTCRWSDDGNFLITEFAIRVAGKKVMSGTQRIGWDGSLNQFRSWVFDSEGGHAEGTWTEVDGVWIVKATGVRPDGEVGSATQMYEPQESGGFVFTVTDRLIAGEELPDFTARAVRKPPAPEKPADRPASPQKK